MLLPAGPVARTPPTVVRVRREHGRLRTVLRGGLLRPQRLHGPDDRCRVGLLAATALLLGGDVVELEVDVGPGVTLDLVDVAGTVAYDGRGVPADWRVDVRVADGGRLRWAGEPFVVADGADVTRSLDLAVADGGRALLRETLVLGRTGQQGGRLRSRTEVRRGGRPVLVEDARLDPATHRRLPGMLGELRVLDSLLAVGADLPEPPVGPTGHRASRFSLPEPGCALGRALLPDLASSPVHRWWAATGETVD
ncbi:urease accessory protein [Friedmanniella luteola]|uniref:Urease accessory protein UreD n=1 Tax=Friedmanniella luteola TaxID=546871 RepID=A0A1H1P1L5_9ACTN|nr:urease accessory protein UreD [Friedmanniella luteola]SDS05117.1 urease accessory protein [Friedmanniella luteola]